MARTMVDLRKECERIERLGRSSAVAYAPLPVARIDFTHWLLEGSVPTRDAEPN